MPLPLASPVRTRRILPMSTGARKKLWLAVETAVAVLIVGAVAWSFRNSLAGIDPRALPIRVRLELLVPAGALYLLAHLSWSAFWVRLLHYEGVGVSWGAGLRTYYLSQLGKYLPGKVWVPLLRMRMLGRHGAHPVPVAVTAVYETLTSVSAGALLAVLFLPQLGVLPPELSVNQTALLAVVALPLGLAVLNQFAARIARKRRGPDARPLPAPSVWLLAQGLVHGAAGYGLLALSLGLTIRGLVADVPGWTPLAFTTDLGAVALCYVAGFVVVVAPGGLGAREAVLKWALVPQFLVALGPEQGGAVALLVALALRVTWTVAEVAVALPLLALRPSQTPAEALP